MKNKTKIFIIVISIILVSFVVASAVHAVGCCMNNCCCREKRGATLVGWGCACQNGNPVEQVCYYYPPN